MTLSPELRRRYVRNVIETTAREGWPVAPGYLQIMCGLRAIADAGLPDEAMPFMQAVIAQRVINDLDDDRSNVDTYVDHNEPGGVTIKAQILRQTEEATVERAVERLAGEVAHV